MRSLSRTPVQDPPVLNFPFLDPPLHQTVLPLTVLPQTSTSERPLPDVLVWTPSLDRLPHAPGPPLARQPKNSLFFSPLFRSIFFSLSEIFSLNCVRGSRQQGDGKSPPFWPPTFWAPSFWAPPFWAFLLGPHHWWPRPFDPHSGTPTPGPPLRDPPLRDPHSGIPTLLDLFRTRTLRTSTSRPPLFLDPLLDSTLLVPRVDWLTWTDQTRTVLTRIVLTR